MSVVRCLVEFRADDEGCRCDELTLEMLSRTATRVGGISVLANKALAVGAVHPFHEVALSFRGHGCFADSQHVTDSAEVLGQVHITDFVWLDSQVGAVHAEQVPDMEMRIGDFAVREEFLRLYET